MVYIEYCMWLNCFEYNGMMLLEFIYCPHKGSCSSSNRSSVLKMVVLNLRWFLLLSFLKSGIKLFKNKSSGESSTGCIFDVCFK